MGRAEPWGLLDDNVQSAAAFLDAYDSTGDERWIERTKTVMEYCGRAHGDPDGGFFDLAAGRREGEDTLAYLRHPAKPVQDSPTPSANGTAALVLARLWALTDEQSWRRDLERLAVACAPAALELSLYGATLLRALDWVVHPPTRIEIQGPRGEGEACAMHLAALQVYRPRRAVLRRTADAPRATVCVGTVCSLPVATNDELRPLLLATSAGG
jgi:uncharacterized protein YyaL (SSP411 family)